MRTKGVGPQGLGISKASPLKQTREELTRMRIRDKKRKRNRDPKVTASMKEVSDRLNARRKETIKKYGDVIDYKGQSQLTSPVDLFFNSGKKSGPRGGTMDRLVEGAKNVIVPGRYLNKLYRAYKYKNRGFH